MEKKKYTLGFVVICKDGSHIHDEAVTWEDEGLVNAENNIAWRYVIAENENAKYRGAIIKFDDTGRTIDGSKPSLKRTPLYKILFDDLHAAGFHYIELADANKLRQKFYVTHKDYAKKLDEVIDYLRGSETESQSASKEEKKMDTNKIVDELIQECSIENVNSIETETTVSSNVDTVEIKTAPAVEVVAESANVKEEDNIYNPYDEMVEPAMPVPDKSAELKVFAFYNGKRGYVNRVTKFWLNDEDFYVGIVYKNDVKVGSWTWNAKFKYPKYKPVAGQLDGDGETAFMYVYPKQLAAMTEKDRLNHVNINGYILAITVALAKQGIVTKYKPQKEYGARVADQSSVRTVTGRTYKKPEPVVVGSGPDDNDLAFYE